MANKTKIRTKFLWRFISDLYSNNVPDVMEGGLLNCSILLLIMVPYIKIHGAQNISQNIKIS